MLPDRDRQILQAHAQLINLVVQAGHNPAQRAELEPVLRAAEQNGWNALVGAIRRILAGERELRSLQAGGLDEEDGVIVEGILRGLHDPATLPDPNAAADPSLAAPGLAAMIHAAGHGDPQALEWLGHMAEQMSRVGGDMSRLGGLMRRLVNGERDPDALGRGLGAQGQQLIHSILEELGKLEVH